MERFRKYVGKGLNLENVKDAEKLSALGIAGRYVPDPPEDFDEFEFTTEFEGREVLIMVTVARGRIQRILFTLIDPEDPELTRPLDQARLREFLAARGDRLVEFFEYVTG